MLGATVSLMFGEYAPATETVGMIAGATVVAVLRHGDIIVPRGPTVLHGGDRLRAIARAIAHEPLRRIAGSPQESERRADQEEPAP